MGTTSVWTVNCGVDGSEHLVAGLLQHLGEDVPDFQVRPWLLSRHQTPPTQLNLLHPQHGKVNKSQSTGRLGSSPRSHPHYVGSARVRIVFGSAKKARALGRWEKLRKHVCMWILLD